MAHDSTDAPRAGRVAAAWQAMPSEADIALRAALTERLQRNGIRHVIGVVGPDSEGRFALFLEGGGKNTEAYKLLVATPLVEDVTRSKQTGSIMTFRVNRSSGAQVAP